eukprot:TRINITY_DN32331_c0_g1_i1.p1 TRINITY_DN32331_c0_g1~~TRINITY_DN32331_c0_g1_i1.p1  ORF type:complete len:256 (+),score=56.25 TRINITY_DN32331_c0_g1_i1:43-810(+)
MPSAKDAASAALDRAEAAGRKAALAWTRSQGRLPQGDIQDVLWDPRGSSERLGKYLVAAHELRGAGTSLTTRHGAAHKEYLDSMDRQLAEVEQTRAMIAAACGGTLPWRQEPDLAGAAEAKRAAPTARDGRGRMKTSRPRATSAAAAAALGATRPAQFPEVAPSEPAAVSSNSGRVAKGSSKPVVVQLCPTPCPDNLIGQECPCCLLQMESKDKVLAFPCPAGHSFHAACLQGWLKAAGSRSTCPVCRAWPQKTS